jgi:hypothetical protein
VHGHDITVLNCNFVKKQSYYDVLIYMVYTNVLLVGLYTLQICDRIVNLPLQLMGNDFEL